MFCASFENLTYAELAQCGLTLMMELDKHQDGQLDRSGAQQLMVRLVNQLARPAALQKLKEMDKDILCERWTYMHTHTHTCCR